MYCLLRRFFNLLDDYEFLSSLSSLDFHQKRLNVKPYFWRGTTALFSSYFAVELRSKKRKLAYIIKTIMLERLGRVSPTAFKNFINKRVYLSICRYETKLKNFISSESSVNDDTSNNSESDDDKANARSAILSSINNPPSIYERTLAALECDRQETDSDNDSIQGTSTQLYSQLNRNYDDIISAQKAVDRYPPLDEDLKQRIISDPNPPNGYVKLLNAYSKRDESLNNYKNTLISTCEAPVSYQDDLDDEFFINRDDEYHNNLLNDELRLFEQNRDID